MTEIEIQVIKDEENERPIPTVWRPIFHGIVNAFVNDDYVLSSGFARVGPIPKATANQIRKYIQDYGEALVELPEESWETSICIWMGDRWGVFIDLWTEAEGRSDLVLSAGVSEKNEGYLVNVEMVYVP